MIQQIEFQCYGKTPREVIFKALEKELSVTKEQYELMDYDKCLSFLEEHDYSLDKAEKGFVIYKKMANKKFIFLTHLCEEYDEFVVNKAIELFGWTNLRGNLAEKYFGCYRDLGAFIYKYITKNISQLANDEMNKCIIFQFGYSYFVNEEDNCFYIFKR